MHWVCASIFSENLPLALLLIQYHKYSYIANKNAFQKDTYGPLVDRIPACTAQRGVCLGVSAQGGVADPPGTE